MSARVLNELLTNHRRDIKTQGEGRWTRQGWIYPMCDVIRHIFIAPLLHQRNSKGENDISGAHFCVTYVDGFVHQLWHMSGFQLFCVNRDGCPMWSRKCSHLISLPLRSSWFYPFIIHRLHDIICQSKVHCLRINDSGLFVWISLGLILLLESFGKGGWLLLAPVFCLSPMCM